MRIRQLLIEARRCEADLDDADALLALLRAAAAAVGATEHAGSTARFVPHGVTAVLILAESHMLLSTWPEHGLALIDVLLCNDAMEPREAWAVIRAALRPAEEASQEVVRNVG
jgi:S-adenosylmethionine decarboxylase